MLDFLDYMYENYAKDGKGAKNEKDTGTAQLDFNLDDLAQKVAEKLSGVNTAGAEPQSDAGAEPQPDAGSE